MLELDESSRTELIELLDEADRRTAEKDCVFFIENYLKTFDPRPEAYPHNLDFILYDFQKDYVKGLVDAIQTGYDIFDEKSRDMGASWLALAVRFWFWTFDDGYQSLIGSRKEEYVDDNTLASLFGKFDYFIDNIKDPQILPEGFDKKKHRTYMKLINPANGNVIKGESSNKNFSRGGRYKDVLFDEVGFWPDARASWSAAGDATRCRHAVTTPPDQPSFAKTLRFSNKVKIRSWHWRLHPKKDQIWYDYEKTRRSEEEVLHELDISWEYSASGRPYPEIKQVKVGTYPYNPDAPLYMSIDLGLDAVALGWYQPIPNTDWIVLVDAFEEHDKVIDWFYPMWGGEFENKFTYTDKDLEFIAMVRQWKKPVMFGDPSGKQRHVESGISAYTKIDETLDIRVQVNEIENNWVARRDETKKLLLRLAVNDTERTRWWLECMKDAHYPKRLETSQATTGITMPVHDFTSHHRTQTEYFAVNYKLPRVDTSTPRTDSAGSTGYYAKNGKIVGAGIDIESIVKNANRRRR